MICLGPPRGDLRRLGSLERGVAGRKAPVAEQQEPLRSTLVLHYRHEATTAEIAERLDLAQDTVRWRLRKGVAELRSKLDRDEAGGARGPGGAEGAGASVSPWAGSVGVGGGITR